MFCIIAMLVLLAGHTQLYGKNFVLYWKLLHIPNIGIGNVASPNNGSLDKIVARAYKNFAVQY